ncbi:MAG: hypothetical protein LC798_11275, partial [Chloroflexi bacterium]|nr:hypothetical protein [Chloroflexota bacterium]
MTPLRVLSVNAGQDTGGQGIRIAQAFGRHAPDWTVNSAVHSAAYTDYPIDQPWRQPVLRQLW